MKYKVIDMGNSSVIKNEPFGYIVARFYGIKREFVEKVASMLEEEVK